MQEKKGFTPFTTLVLIFLLNLSVSVLVTHEHICSAAGYISYVAMILHSIKSIVYLTIIQ